MKIFKSAVALFLAGLSVVFPPPPKPQAVPIFSASYTNFDDAALIGDVATIAGAKGVTAPVQRVRLVFKNANGDVATVFIANSEKFQDVVERMKAGKYALVEYSPGAMVQGK